MGPGVCTQHLMYLSVAEAPTMANVEVVQLAPLCVRDVCTIGRRVVESISQFGVDRVTRDLDLLYNGLMKVGHDRRLRLYTSRGALDLCRWTCCQVVNIDRAGRDRSTRSKSKKDECGR